MLKVGQTLKGKYKILHALTIAGISCGMGNIFLANILGTKTLAIVKEILQSNFPLQQWNVAQTSFQREIEIYNLLKDSPMVPKLYETEVTNLSCIMVMEYVDGWNLEDWLDQEFLKKNQSIPEKELINIGKSICEFIQKLHDLNRIHRDTKPANIIMTKSGELKFIDFGIARKMKQQFDTGTAMTSIGTEHYAPPEAYISINKPPEWTILGDIHTIGATLYHLAIGKMPAKVWDWQDIKTENPTLSEEFCTIVKKALDPKAENRWQSAKKMYDALDSINKPPVVHPQQVFPILTQPVQTLKKNPESTTVSKANLFQEVGKWFKKIGKTRLFDPYAEIKNNIDLASNITWQNKNCEKEFAKTVEALEDAMQENLEIQIKNLHSEAMDIAFKEQICQLGFFVFPLDAEPTYAETIKKYEGKLKPKEFQAYMKLKKLDLPIGKFSFSSYWNGAESQNTIYLSLAGKWYEVLLTDPNLQPLTQGQITKQIPSQGII